MRFSKLAYCGFVRPCITDLHLRPSIDIVEAPTLFALATNQVMSGLSKSASDEKSTLWTKGVVPYDASNLKRKSKINLH